MGLVKRSTKKYASCALSLSEILAYRFDETDLDLQQMAKGVFQ